MTKVVVITLSGLLYDPGPAAGRPRDLPREAGALLHLAGAPPRGALPQARAHPSQHCTGADIRVDLSGHAILSRVRLGPSLRYQASRENVFVDGLMEIFTFSAGKSNLWYEYINRSSYTGTVPVSCLCGGS